MITIKSLKTEKEKVVDEIKNGDLKKVKENRLRKRIAYLDTCIKYLETHPDESYMKLEIGKLETKMNFRMECFKPLNELMLSKKDLSKMKKAHEKQYEIPKLREQIKTLRFILKAV